uniref:RING-type E3 ubiquitin transferase n=1 Tax=Myotis lucifugus TaxID=59463 RepID=G1Q5F8_MYOLU
SWAPLVDPVVQLPCGKALYSYEGKEPGDLKFNKGDVIILRRRVDEHWFHGELRGTHGFLPASYVQCLRPLPPTPPQGKALYDFEMKDRDQDQDCLTFTKDEILTVIRRVDDNWAEGMLGDKIGIFPLLYVELNDSAKQLIAMDKPSDPGAVASVAPGLTLSSTGAVSAFQQRVDGKKNAKKRHSFTAVSLTHRSSQAASHRHSVEISAPVLISSSDPRATARIRDLAHVSCSAPTQVTSSGHGQTREGCIRKVPGTPLAPGECGEFWPGPAPSQSTPCLLSPRPFHPPPTLASVIIAAFREGGGRAWNQCPPQPAACGGGPWPAVVNSSSILKLKPTFSPTLDRRYLALYTYKPQKSDELELRKGEMYCVLEKCQDGWFKGTSLRSGLSGVFPGNYVTPASSGTWSVSGTWAPLGGAGPPGNNVVGGSPLAKGMATSIHPGGGSLSSPATAARAALPLATPQAQHQAASPPVGSCLWHSAPPAASQARSTVPTGVAHAQDQPTTMVSPLCTQNSPSRLPTASLRPHSMVSLQHLHQPPVQTITGAQCPWPAIPLTSAASAVTPPNVTAANLNGEAGVGTVSGLSTSSPTNVSKCGLASHSEHDDAKEKKSGLLKLLAGASTKKKNRSPPSISPTHDPHVAVDASLQGAVGLEVSSLSLHGRAGSCPIESKIQGAMGMEPLHRKTGSLDLNFSSSPSRKAPFSMAAARPEPKPFPRERYRVVVSYPPQSEAEIELKEGDIVFVHKKREDGWYKGTLQRNGRTGLFPGSFVESF